MAAPAETRVLVCGGGNAAHVCAGLIGSLGPHIIVNVLDTYQDEASKWGNKMTVEFADGRPSVVGNINKVSKNPDEVVPGTNVALLALPTFGHSTYLECLKGKVDKGTIVAALVDRGGFDLRAWHHLGRDSGVILSGFNTLPWACRIKTYGSEVEVLGTKEELSQVVSPASGATRAQETLTMLLGGKPQLKLVGSFLVAPFALGGVIHPQICYGALKNWDGKPFAEPPLFYQAVDDFTAATMEKVSDEHKRLAARLGEVSGVDMKGATTVYDWLTSAYAGQITDKSTLKSSFNTNAAYAGLKHPVKEVEGGYTIDFTARYYAEDVPLGMVFVRALAELLDFPTPAIDEVLLWCQGAMGKEYLKDGRLDGKDIPSTGIPQNFGFKDMASLIEQYKSG